jgi:hypothetical protein
MTQKIEPTYVTFEQDKRLKEKGFNENCNGHLVIKTGGIGKGKQFIHEGRLDYDDIYLEYVEENIPEQWQVVEWLRVNHGIWIEVIETDLFQKYFFQIKRKDNTRLKDGDFNSPQEAYSAAFDYILNNLI